MTRHPAPGQLAFRFTVDWLPIEPVRPAVPERGFDNIDKPPIEPPRPLPEKGFDNINETLSEPPLVGHWWRRPRTAPPRPKSWSDSSGREERTIAKWIAKSVRCALCGCYDRPACMPCRVGGRLLLLCKSCDDQPSAVARLVELTSVDWRSARIHYHEHRTDFRC